MSKPLFLGVEIGGTKLQVGLGHADGSLLDRKRTTVPVGADAATVRQTIVDEVRRICGASGRTADAIDAVGIGFGGPVDVDRGLVIRSHQVSGWDEFPLADWFRKQFGVKTVALRNDADTAALAEARLGAGRGCSPLLYVTVGSGVGGGVIRDGRIDRGSGLGAVEIGHLWITRPDDQGHGGLTVEQAASGWSIARQVREALAAGDAEADTLRELVEDDPDQLSTEVVAMAADLGDRLARRALDQAARGLAAGLAEAVTLIAPRRVVLGGGVSQIGDDLWLEPIRQSVDRWVFPPFRGRFDIQRSALGEPIVVLGGLLLAQMAWNKTRSSG